MSEIKDDIPEHVFKMFKESASKHLRNLESACELAGKQSDFQSVDGDKMFHSAHSLKGLASTFGFPEVSDLCEKIEKLLKSLSNENRSSKLEELQNHLSSIKTKLN